MAFSHYYARGWGWRTKDFNSRGTPSVRAWKVHQVHIVGQRRVLHVPAHYRASVLGHSTLPAFPILSRLAFPEMLHESQTGVHILNAYMISLRTLNKSWRHIKGNYRQCSAWVRGTTTVSFKCKAGYPSRFPKDTRSASSFVNPAANRRCVGLIGKCKSLRSFGAGAMDTGAYPSCLL